MIRYVILLRFTERGIKQVSNSTGRAAAFREAAAKAGVRVEGQYWTTGPYDGVLILAAKEEMRLLQCVAALAAAGNVRTQTLRAFDAKEFEGLVRSALARLKDAENQSNSLDSRFDLAYGAAHALCLAALRHHGYRPLKRYIVFQVLPDTLGLGAEVWRVLSKCHDLRNRTEYEGVLDTDERLASDLVGACRKVADKVKGLSPIVEESE